RGERPARAARVRRARTEPAEPAGPGRALSAGADQRQASAVHAQPAPWSAEPQEERAEPDRRDPSRDGRGIRDQERPVDRRGNAERSRSRPGADQRRHSAWGGLLLARLVGGMSRAGPARLRSFQRGGRQSEFASAERHARSGERRHAAPIDALPRSGTLSRNQVARSAGLTRGAVTGRCRAAAAPTAFATAPRGFDGAAAVGIESHSGHLPPRISCDSVAATRRSRITRRCRLRFGLIGYGAWGKHHARAICAAPGLTLAGVACGSDVSADAARRDLPSIRVYLDYRELLRDPSIEAVDVVTRMLGR